MGTDERQAALISQLESGVEEAQFDALVDIGKQRVRSLEPRVWPFLTHASAELRAAAARTLGFHLRVVAARDVLLRLSEEDPAPEVRAAAIMGWTTLLAGTREPDALGRLARWLRDPGAPYPVRANAFWGLLDVGGLPRSRWPAPRAFKDVDAEVPWALVEEVLSADFTPGPPLSPR